MKKIEKFFVIFCNESSISSSNRHKDCEQYLFSGRGLYVPKVCVALFGAVPHSKGAVQYKKGAVQYSKDVAQYSKIGTVQHCNGVVQYKKCCPVSKGCCPV